MRRYKSGVNREQGDLYPLKNKETPANPEALELYKDLPELARP